MGWPSLANLSSLLNFSKLSSRSHLQSHIGLDTPHVNTEVGKTAFSFYVPDKWNRLRGYPLKLNQLISIEVSKALLDNASRRMDASVYYDYVIPL